MKSINPTSPTNSQSNIVPFKLRRSTRRKTTPTVWQRFWEGVIDLLMPSSQPKVTHVIKRDGNEYYQVYDPVTGNSKTFGSEQETRIWLDRRFYDNTRNW